VDLGLNAPWIQEGLAFAAKAGGKTAKAITSLETAISLNPKAGSLYYKLISLLDEEKRTKDAYLWRKRLTQIDQSNIKLVGKLIEDGGAFGATAKEILRWGEMGNHIAPFSIDHHLVFAKELLRLGMKKKARFELKSALVVDPTHAESLKLLSEL